MERDLKIKKYLEHCLNCPTKPCMVNGCPLSNDIPNFISLCKEGNIKGAYEVLTKTTFLGAICGRICPHERQCRSACVRAIKEEAVNIGEIESYIFDKAIEYGYDKDIKKSDALKGKKMAIIGSGPAGLNASAFLKVYGADVTIYEKYNELGGILSHGIPEFRLEKSVLCKTINSIINLGIKTKFNQELGKNINITDLQKEYDAIFIGIGANVPKKMHIEGENLVGVYGGNSLLEYGNHPDYKGKKVAIIGGGNVAMDSARVIKSRGADRVIIVYRREEKDMPAEMKEIEQAKKEKIEFLFNTSIVKILGNQKVEQIECIKNKLEKIEGEKRLIPVNIENSNYTVDIDEVVIAIGAEPEKEVINKLGLELTNEGYIKVDEEYHTSLKGVYAGGDLIGKKPTVAWAAMAGREAAKSILEDLK